MNVSHYPAKTQEFPKNIVAAFILLYHYLYRREFVLVLILKWFRKSTYSSARAAPIYIHLKCETESIYYCDVIDKAAEFVWDKHTSSKSHCSVISEARWLTICESNQYYVISMSQTAICKRKNVSCTLSAEAKNSVSHAASCTKYSHYCLAKFAVGSPQSVFSTNSIVTCKIGTLLFIRKARFIFLERWKQEAKQNN